MLGHCSILGCLPAAVGSCQHHSPPHSTPLATKNFPKINREPFINNIDTFKKEHVHYLLMVGHINVIIFLLNSTNVTRYEISREKGNANEIEYLFILGILELIYMADFSWPVWRFPLK